MKFKRNRAPRETEQQPTPPQIELATSDEVAKLDIQAERVMRIATTNRWRDDIFRGVEMTLKPGKEHLALVVKKTLDATTTSIFELEQIGGVYTAKQYVISTAKLVPWYGIEVETTPLAVGQKSQTQEFYRHEDGPRTGMPNFEAPLHNKRPIEGLPLSAQKCQGLTQGLEDLALTAEAPLQALGATATQPHAERPSSTE